MEGTRIQRKSVHDIMQASEKERASYTIWYCSLHTENIVMAAKGERVRPWAFSATRLLLLPITSTSIKNQWTDAFKYCANGDQRLRQVH